LACGSAIDHFRCDATRHVSVKIAALKLGRARWLRRLESAVSTVPSYVSLSAVQSARKVALGLILLLGLAAFALTKAMVFGDPVHEMVEKIGLALILVCILGRVWCSLYIGGRKVRELVDSGPYSITRNPLYVFSFIGAAGVGAQSGSVLIAAACFLVAWAVFAVLVRSEEKALLKVHRESYAAYMRSTPRFLPNPSLWWDREALTVQPVRIMRTFADGLFFLLAIPVAEGLEYLQHIHVLPALANLP
jgi:protein-S-isoprenylcysteine O-methyltransferase Ste14